MSSQNMPFNAPDFFADVFVTGWGGYNLDVGSKIEMGKKTDLLLGVNYFNYSDPIDNNGDNFTDATLQDRISVFRKWNFKRNDSGRPLQKGFGNEIRRPKTERSDR